MTNDICKGAPFIRRGEEGEGLALYEESQVHSPCDGRQSYNNLIPVPDGDASSFYENSLREAGKQREIGLTCGGRSIK
jgi:hypothetical protein